MTSKHALLITSNQKNPRTVVHLTFQTSKVPRQAMSLAGGVFSLLLHFHPQFPDGASVPRCSPQQIMEKSNNGQLRSIRPRFADGSGGSHVELLTSAPTYKDVPPPTHHHPHYRWNPY